MSKQKDYRTFISVLFHIFNILYQCSQLLCLTIDNHLAVVTNDCYARISIGSKLSDTDVTLQLTVTGLRECEQQCSKHGKSCNAFSFGIGVKGNGTCLISKQIPMLENLLTHQDYDVYMKNQQGSLWCDLNNFYGGFFVFRNGNRFTKIDETNDKQFVTSSSILTTSLPHSVSLYIPLNTQSFWRGEEDAATYKHRGIYDRSINHHVRFLSGDDSHDRILHSLANRNERTALNSPFEVSARTAMEASSFSGLTSYFNTRCSENYFEDLHHYCNLPAAP